MIWDLFKIVIYFFVCVFVIWLSYKVSKTVGKVGGGFGAGKYMRPVDRLMLGKDMSLNIVRLGDKYMLIGASAGSVSLLCEIDAEELVSPAADDSGESGYGLVKEKLFAALKEKLPGKSKNKNFSDMLWDGMDKENADGEYDSNEEYETDMIDELLRKSKKRSEGYKDKKSDK